MRSVQIRALIVDRFRIELEYNVMEMDSTGEQASGTDKAGKKAWVPLDVFLAKAEGSLGLQPAKLYYRLAKQLRDGCIVDVGSHRGRTSVALGRGSLAGTRVPVFSVEPHDGRVAGRARKFGSPDREAYYKAMLETDCYKVVRLVSLSSAVASVGWSMPVGLLAIGGDHSYEGVKSNWLAWKPLLLPNAHVIFDESTNPELGVLKLIQEIVAEGEYSIVEKRGRVTTLVHKAHAEAALLQSEEGSPSAGDEE